MDTTIQITPATQTKLQALNGDCKKFRVVSGTYTCECGKTQYNNLEVKICGHFYPLPRIRECPECKKVEGSEAQMRAVCEDRWAVCKVQDMLVRHKGLYLWGECGVGKTYNAKRLHRAAKAQGIKSQFTTPQGIQTAFNDCISSNMREVEVLTKLGFVDLLIIDDLGQEQVTERGLSQLWEVVNRRYELHKPIVITSNYSLDNLSARYGSVNEVQTSSLCFRISNLCEQQYVNNQNQKIRA